MTLSQDLEDVPWLVRELLVTATREKGIDYYAMAHGSPHGPKPDTPPVPINFGALNARADLTKALADAARTITGGKGIRACGPDVSPPTVYAVVIYAALDVLLTHNDAAHHVAAIGLAIDNARAVIDRKPEHWYAGACECGRHLYATSDSGEIECGCGTVHAVEDRRRRLLAAAEDVLADAATIARCVTWLGGEPVPARRLRVWAHRGKLKSVTTVDGHPHYRIGDVLDLLAAG